MFERGVQRVVMVLAEAVEQLEAATRAAALHSGG
jgi:hypothetical protein